MGGFNLFSLELKRFLFYIKKKLLNVKIVAFLLV